MGKVGKNFLTLGNEKLRSSDFGKSWKIFLTLGNETLRRSSFFGKRWWVHDSTHRKEKDLQKNGLDIWSLRSKLYLVCEFDENRREKVGSKFSP